MCVFSGRLRVIVHEMCEWNLSEWFRPLVESGDHLCWRSYWIHTNTNICEWSGQEERHPKISTKSVENGAVISSQVIRRKLRQFRKLWLLNPTIWTFWTFYNKLKSYWWEKFNGICPIKIGITFFEIPKGPNPLSHTHAPVDVVQRSNQ